MSVAPTSRWAWAEVDLSAVWDNVRALCTTADGSDLWAVVKADGYGHGSVQVARAAMAAGAKGLCVALTQEGAELRAAGIKAPILVLSQQPVDQARELLSNELIPTVYTVQGIEAIAAAAREQPYRWRDLWCPYPMHLKLDTGMHRVGARPEDLASLLAAAQANGDDVRVDAVFTHLAVSDEVSNGYTYEQLQTFDRALHGIWSGPTHAANSGGLIAHPASRRSLVRAGIAVYGISPSKDLDPFAAAHLRPALSLRARVSFVKQVAAQDRISYGLRHRFSEPTNVATVPIGYADGVPRRLFAGGGEVLIGGRRCPIVGVVTMDQLMVDVGAMSVAVGDEVVLIGSQGAETITANEWADRLGTIGYEIVCGISKRVPRLYIGPDARGSEGTTLSR